ncbi:chromosome partitioning protein ParA [Vibrio sp. LaRot3]|uniref:chromosome partitioning protein ParA n=1 Tax=Vibrio sp. LaRot3 TaxID=2998829 RepID=UPI0022CE1B25|nr:chromosome partitioning protein ParA [Vibrio sp. LaRot3]MDA0147428.1 chromosome partitioning protein ParA [Vibrio sp. LaRot3]
MNTHNEHDDNEDVVVIEQRDKRTYAYIAIAGALGLALGGLIGSSMTANKWQQTYLQLEKQVQTLEQDKKQLVVKVEQKVAKVDDEVANKLKLAMTKQQQDFEQQLAAMQSQVAELEKVNISLEEQIDQQKQRIADADKQNNQLNHQADMQVTLLERSRELFQRELKVKQELDSLLKEREELEPKLVTLKKQCDAYLDGTSWDAKSDSCDKQDDANSRISQINQMIRVHQMDLEQIKAIAEQMGLE